MQTHRGVGENEQNGVHLLEFWDRFSIILGDTVRLPEEFYRTAQCSLSSSKNMKEECSWEYENRNEALLII